MKRLLSAALILQFAVCASPPTAGAEQEIERDFDSVVRPLLERYCHDCHAGDVTEGDLDLGGFKTLTQVRRNTKAWLKIREMLATGQMPPKDSPQLSEQERDQLQQWVRTFLAQEAAAHAGDPGPITLRRLSNAEYTAAIQDLTQVATLEPTQEFPVDGAAGEGFTNVGSGQGMSPALIQKYLDAAKQVSQHAVLLPDGVRFSPHTTARDQTDELLTRIREFYNRHTVDGGGAVVDPNGIPLKTDRGGVLPLESYLAATLEERTALSEQQKTISQVAEERSLNAKYLETLWTVLNQRNQDHPSLLLDAFRAKWKTATADSAAALAGEIATVQGVLWKYNSIGHIGREGGPTRWLEPVVSLASSREFRLKLPDAATADVVLFLAAHDLDDGNDQDIVVWKNARLEFPPNPAGVGHPPVLLKDLRQLAAGMEQMIPQELARTRQYLQAVVELTASKQPLAEIAESHQLNPQLLEHWTETVGLGSRVSRKLTGHFQSKLEKAQGYPAVNGWGSGQTPSLLTNNSDEAITFLTLTIPARGVVVHPSPASDSVVAWRSPIAGEIRLEGLVADADDKCGNGAAWNVEIRSVAGRVPVADGVFDNGGRNRWKSEPTFTVAAGDVVAITVNARDANHSCDTTQIELNITEIGGKDRKWSLIQDVVDKILESNPLPDSYGNPQTWHFLATESRPNAGFQTPPGSALARWHEAVTTSKPAAEIEALAGSVQSVLTSVDPETLAEPDRLLRNQLLDWKGVLRWTTVSQSAVAQPDGKYGLGSDRFGRHPNGAALDPADLGLQAPEIIEVKIPAALASGGEFVVAGALDAAAGRGGSVQLQLLEKKPEPFGVSLSAPFLVHEGSESRLRLANAIGEFQTLFPPALCYTRIVPIDEVVTLTLFHREDDHLQRLMLDDGQRKELDRLWDELTYVSREPLQLVVAYEQLVEFATQDRPDLVVAFAPLREPINKRAEQFRQRLEDTEEVQLDAVSRFADRAWRRPLTQTERDDLHATYQRLRSAELPHDEAVRLTLARVLTSPAFLYKLEQPGPGRQAADVSPRELASRLSFFLWSSAPDDELRSAAETGRLTDDDVLIEQTERMLHDARTRRLAIQFACQWLHVRDFDKHDEKNESLFPQFAALRHDMNEETVRFFEDMFRDNGSILDVLEADHTFLNARLAAHYGIDGVQGDAWQRRDGIRDRGRGGILGMATFLAGQSGASRTSPILRGNWVYETLLGERLPRPPAGVPQLPDTLPAGLTERELIEKHSSVAACAKCHAKIDPYGFALEQFDAIGRLRREEVNTTTTLPGGEEIEGLAGLRDYLSQVRRDDFTRQFCKKLLGFALGRETQLSDEPLLSKMQLDLAAHNFRFHHAVECIVTSPQFRKIRGLESSDD